MPHSHHQDKPRGVMSPGRGPSGRSASPLQAVCPSGPSAPPGFSSCSEGALFASSLGRSPSLPPGVLGGAWGAQGQYRGTCRRAGVGRCEGVASGGWPAPCGSPAPHARTWKRTAEDLLQCMEMGAKPYRALSTSRLKEFQGTAANCSGTEAWGQVHTSSPLNLVGGGGRSAVGPMGWRWVTPPPRQVDSGRLLPDPAASTLSGGRERPLQGWAQRVPRASSGLSRTRGRGSISDACHGPLTGQHVLPELGLDCSLFPSCLTVVGGGVLRRARGRRPQAGTRPWNCHLFTRWKYSRRKPGSTVLLQTSSCVWG